jgi:hypothetical protein
MLGRQHALRAAGCHCFVEDNQFFASPPARHIEWDEDPEAAIEQHYHELLDLLLAEHLTIH